MRKFNTIYSYSFSLLAFIELFLCIRHIVAGENEETKVTVETTNDRHFATRDTLYFELLEPDQIAYVYKIRPAKDFGSPLNVTLVETELVPVLPSDGCGKIENVRDVRGNVALVLRGECSFLSKAVNAERVGAVAVIITDNDETNDDKFIDMINDGTTRTVHIPAFFLLGKDGSMIRKHLERLRLRSAVINIPINATLRTDLPRQLPPWTLWEMMSGTFLTLKHQKNSSNKPRIT